MVALLLCLILQISPSTFAQSKSTVQTRTKESLKPIPTPVVEDKFSAEQVPSALEPPPAEILPKSSVDASNEGSLPADFRTQIVPDSFAVLQTSFGDIRLKFFKSAAPATVSNFVGLAKGTLNWKDVKSGKTQKGIPFYQNLLFHRIHPELGIQTGCPWGTGHGWPGFMIPFETQDKLKFDRPYLVGLSLIPGKNGSGGSQFFITTKPSPHLDGKYPIFAEVISGFDVVKTISRQKRDALMKPLKPILLKGVVIE